MNLKRKAALLLSVFAALLSMVSFTGTASAVANCNGKTLLSANYVKLTNGSGSSVGSIQLCRDGDNYFAMYINYGTMGSGRKANAHLYSYVNGNPANNWNCDSPDGNKHVQAGETWCRTPLIRSTSGGVTFRARGLYYALQSGQWNAIAEGWTARCNKSACYAS